MLHISMDKTCRSRVIYETGDLEDVFFFLFYCWSYIST